MKSKIENIKADIIIMNGDKKLMNDSLNSKKIVLAAIEMGENITQTVNTGWSEYLKANAQLKGPTTSGTCFCQKPATHLVYFWR